MYNIKFLENYGCDDQQIEQIEDEDENDKVLAFLLGEEESRKQCIIEKVKCRNILVFEIDTFNQQQADVTMKIKNSFQYGQFQQAIAEALLSTVNSNKIFIDIDKDKSLAQYALDQEAEHFEYMTSQKEIKQNKCEEIQREQNEKEDEKSNDTIRVDTNKPGGIKKGLKQSNIAEAFAQEIVEKTNMTDAANIKKVTQRVQEALKKKQH